MMRPTTWSLMFGCLAVFWTGRGDFARSGLNDAGNLATTQREAGEMRHAELAEFSRRFQRTPTTPNFGAVNRRQPRTGQADPLAFQQGLTRIHFRAVGREDRPAEVDRFPLTPRMLDRSGIRDLDLQRPRTLPGDPLGFQRVLTTADRWRLKRESPPDRADLLAPDRTPTAGTLQTINAVPRSLRPDRAGPYPCRAPNAAYSMFRHERPLPEFPPETGPPPPVETRAWTFNHDHVSPSRSVPARHGRVGTRSASTVSDRWFRRPPNSGMRP